ncbi:Histone deacetylase [Thalictrum thalictroides]|uniref:Histone deacetylase n=1 Tax=Thalictrum thalictroides TaxID=46969 RepID=A0A7J6V3H0_THATH|nr:Histone deacetylase [Thalictrum thalictroides]
MTEFFFSRCKIYAGAEAEEKDLRLCHEEWYLRELRKVINGDQVMPERYDSIYVCKGTWVAACCAVGTVIEASKQVMVGKTKSAVAVVRPPGHHAEATKAFGFCFFNNVAIAARVLLRDKLASKIVIIDWDIHHGNGTQKEFWNDKSVLYFSVHRTDLFPYQDGGEDGECSQVGDKDDRGHNIIAFDMHQWS